MLQLHGGLQWRWSHLLAPYSSLYNVPVSTIQRVYYFGRRGLSTVACMQTNIAMKNHGRCDCDMSQRRKDGERWTDGYICAYTYLLCHGIRWNSCECEGRRREEREEGKNDCVNCDWPAWPNQSDMHTFERLLWRANRFLLKFLPLLSLCTRSTLSIPAYASTHKYKFYI